MGKYSAGIATQTKIVDCCKNLFYQNGVAGTSYEEICAAASINRGLIPYYFKSKNNIAAMIFKEFIENGDQLIRELCGEDENLRFVITNALYYDLEKRDPQLLPVYDEIETNAFWADTTLAMQYTIMSKLIDYNRIEMDQAAKQTIACMCEGVERELVHGIASGFLTEDAWSIASRDCYFFFGVLGMERQRIQQYLDKGREFYHQYCLYCAPDFSVVLRTR